MNKLRLIAVPLIMLLWLCPAAAQTVETVDGVRMVHNGRAGRLEGVTLRLIRVIGGLDIEDENLAFGAPYDVDLDSAGNIYILDNRNDRIQKLDPDGKFLLSIGRRGQGPGEFQRIFSFDIDAKDKLHVFDVGNRRIQVLNPDGGVDDKKSDHDWDGSLS